MAQEHYRTEFFETAVKRGFYGLERGGLEGIKDNCRKYWEDTVNKFMILPAVDRVMRRKGRIRIVDLGCGSGEGLNLICHIPYPEHPEPPHDGFLIWRGEVERYAGLDISPSMVEQGRKNYADWPNVSFHQHDLGDGFPLKDQPPFDIYFSSYAALSHLTAPQLENLLVQLLSHADEGGCIVLDLYGRLSPEWPQYWDRSCREMLEYNMAYLLPPEHRQPRNIESFKVCFWSGRELADAAERAARRAGRKIGLAMKDRSLFVGRHMDTGLFNGNPMPYRSQVNRLFHRDYRCDLSKLMVSTESLEPYREKQPAVLARLEDYARQWNTVVTSAKALLVGDDDKVRSIIEAAPKALAEDLKMLAWIQRSSDRFPVADFWASIMGPQIACVLRNLEFSLSPGLGCGHGLLGLISVGW